jgi:hypothetical protein
VGSEDRYRMLETIREYGLERLAASWEEAATRRAHSAYCVVLAEEGTVAWTTTEQAAWLSRFEMEHDNFRAALDWLAMNREMESATSTQTVPRDSTSHIGPPPRISPSTARTPSSLVPRRDSSSSSCFSQ